MVRGNQGHAPCKTFRSKTPHVSGLLWAPTSLMVLAPAYLRNEGGTHNSGVHELLVI